MKNNVVLEPEDIKGLWTDSPYMNAEIASTALQPFVDILSMDITDATWGKESETYYRWVYTPGRTPDVQNGYEEDITIISGTSGDDGFFCKGRSFLNVNEDYTLAYTKTVHFDWGGIEEHEDEDEEYPLYEYAVVDEDYLEDDELEIDVQSEPEDDDEASDDDEDDERYYDRPNFCLEVDGELNDYYSTARKAVSMLPEGSKPKFVTIYAVDSDGNHQEWQVRVRWKKSGIGIPEDPVL